MMKPKNNCTCTETTGCINCDQWTVWVDTIERLTQSFCKHIRNYISEEELAAAVATQTGLNDIFDANQAMADACEDVGCLESLGAEEDSPVKVQNNCDIMNAAWEWAAKRGFARAS